MTSTRRLNNLSDAEILKALAGTDVWVMVQDIRWEDPKYVSQTYFYWHNITQVANGKVYFLETVFTPNIADLDDPECSTFLERYMESFSIVRPLELITTAEILEDFK